MITGKNTATFPFLDFDCIWNRQAVPQATNQLALAIAPRVLRVLTSDHRPVTNVTEWAKRADCWSTIKSIDVDVPPEFRDDLVSKAEAKDNKRSARNQQKVDHGIQGQAAVLEIPQHDYG